MVYLLDTDVFIRAKREHYRFNTFPCFWEYLKRHDKGGNRIESLVAVRKELENHEDELTSWVKSCPAQMFVSQENQATIEAAKRVAAWVVQHPQYYDAAKAKFLSGADYWLVSHALAHGHTLVTHEVRAPDAKNRVKIPDACDAHGVRSCPPWLMLEELGATF